MPRGTCENCEQHDMFVHIIAPESGSRCFVCARCLGLSQLDERDESDAPSPSPNLRLSHKRYTRRLND